MIKTALILTLTGVLSLSALAGQTPNIVVILADDMGFGEVQHLNPERGKIKTPQLDALAKEGMVFTDAHSGSSVCTPTRYGLMTGRYAWRTSLQNGVLTGGESLIAKDRLTMAKMLKAKGYHTAMVGKWHLGMLYDGVKVSGKVEVGAKVTHGPIDRGGFDVFYGFHHARQMDLWIDQDVVKHRMTAEEMLPRLTETAVDYIKGRKGNEQPFFLYVPWNSPHSPVTPSKEWQGKSGLNAHGDFVMQTDDSFGRVIQALKDAGLFENTLVICSADNGTSHSTSKMADLKKLGHFSSANLRGSKADIWDGGHRVPFIASWPQEVDAGSRTDALICLTDVMATAADLAGATIPVGAAEDSQSFADVLRKPTKKARESVIHHSISGLFAIRQGEWKLICCPGSGGWSKPGVGEALKTARANKEPIYQLYNMTKDLSEEHNLAASMAEKVKTMRALLDQQIAAHKNDVAVEVDKWDKPEKPKRPKKPKKKKK